MFLLRSMSILMAACLAASDEICTEATCSEDSSWGAGWLQENYAVSQRLITDSITESVIRAEGPLTVDMSIDDFTDFQVPFGMKMVLFFVAIVLLAMAHELYVSTGKKPLLANHEKSNTIPLQMMFLICWFVPFISSSLVVPLSLDYAIAMGQTATGSGVYLGGGTIFSCIGLILGKGLTSEQNWDQKWARQVHIRFSALGLVGYFCLAFVTQASTTWSLPARRQWFWWSQLCMGAATTVITLPTITWNTMWNKITPARDKTFWMIMAQCCRNGGFILGPPVFAAISAMVRQGREVSPISMMAWSYIGLISFSLFNVFYAMLVFPTEIHPEPELPAEANNDQALEAAPEQLEPEDRERIVFLMVAYAFERPFSVAAIEVATIMLLEVSYGWSAEMCGFAFIVIAASSLMLTATSTLLLQRKIVSESTVFITASTAGLCGVFLLFNWHAFGDFGAGSLLLADAIVYGGASVANGIGEGWGCRAATPGTSYSIEVYRVRNIMGVNVSRFLAPITARFILDFGGRNVYAVLQLLLCCMGTWTVYKTVSLVWKGTAAGLGTRKAEEAHETKATPPLGENLEKVSN